MRTTLRILWKILFVLGLIIAAVCMFVFGLVFCVIPNTERRQ